ncbi:MAG: EamA family transporter [Nitrospirae bacterium]|nr:EamA family transporter [Nitrospirota bacterium]
MHFSWVILSLISAFTLATSDAFTKKALTTNNEYIVAWMRLVLSLPLLFVTLLFIPFPKIDKYFYIAFLTSIPLEILSIILYIKALRLSPLSLTLPFLALTPLFLIFVSYIIVGEKISLMGCLGILLIVLGSYTLNISQVKEGILEPIRAISKEKGSILMIGVALIYSITSSLGKMAIKHSSALFFGATYFTALVLIFTPIALYKGRGALKDLLNKHLYTQSLLLPGIFYSFMVISHMLAMSIAKVAYVISVKRMSLLIGVLYGWLFFREENIRERLFGAMLMFTGFVLVVTAS